MQKSSTSLPTVNINWPVEQVQAFTTLRQPLVNKTKLNDFGLFNLGLHVGDNSAAVLVNRKSLHALLPPNSQIQWLEQVHGADVVTVEQVSSTPLVADAAITRQKHLALAVMTADCLPILITNISGTEIAAIHGGWRPLASHIISNTIDALESSPNELCAWLGPCIGPNAFEVGEEVKEVFVAISDELGFAFKASKNAGKYFADLHQIAKYLLVQSGVSTHYQLADCTYSNSNYYYSYRRDKHTGRMASIICRQ
ncbi:peptidoglycan editing factor PgeF [Thalassotalea sp. M1531]|uniref:Purine nucleoside phosphorylase n=1 Tax=Thalassotalea algicola TaxID=2716224 RepID=A0A7Y0LEU0_9GAMM|nr:peptidoglycan editing factor PgeF [Thalassotalea algicola]NMP32864.1 peptidoglycan editing factor PgeF [Thalassotalea algicola]